MKVICEKTTKISKFLLHDHTDVEMNNDSIVVGAHENYPMGFSMTCHNSEDCTLYENVMDVPSDWVGNKYLYDGKWAANADYAVYVNPNEEGE